MKLQPFRTPRMSFSNYLSAASSILDPKKKNNKHFQLGFMCSEENVLFKIKIQKNM